MKTIFKLMLVLVSLLVISCGKSSLGFVNPQPNGIKPLQQIDKELYGDYFIEDSTLILIDFHQTFENKNDSASKSILKNIFTINQTEMINTIEGELNILKTSLDSADKFKLLYKHDLDSTITQYIPNPTYSYTIDSFDNWYKIKISIKSVLFNISEYNILKEFKGKYYINKYDSASHAWTCIQLDYNNKVKTLSINTLSSNDVSVFKRLVEVEQNTDSVCLFINPTKNTFKKFLRMKGFEDKICMKRE